MAQPFCNIYVFGLFAKKEIVLTWCDSISKMLYTVLYDDNGSDLLFKNYISCHFTPNDMIQDILVVLCRTQTNPEFPLTTDCWFLCQL